MTIVPLRHYSGSLERITCQNWCKHNIGMEDPHKWFAVEASNDNIDNIILSRSLKSAGLVHSIVFYKDEDAVAFKLRFGL